MSLGSIENLEQVQNVQDSPLVQELRIEVTCHSSSYLSKSGCRSMYAASEEFSFSIGNSRASKTFTADESRKMRRYGIRIGIMRAIFQISGITRIEIYNAGSLLRNPSVLKLITKRHNLTKKFCTAPSK